MSDRGTAVAMTCDAAYLPIVLHLARQISRGSLTRAFDILIVTEEPLSLPDWAKAEGIQTVLVPRQAWIDQMPIGHRPRVLPRAVYLSLALADALGDRYRRILYLDGDIYFEGGDLDRLLDLPMGGHPVAAVRDILLFRNPNHHAAEYRAMGLPALNYLNAGVLLIDTAAWRAAGILEQCVALRQSHPKACILHDQSVLNAVLRGRFAELAPHWNWQVNLAVPMATFSYPVAFRHFIGREKPWKDTEGASDARFLRSYAEFFRVLMPNAFEIAETTAVPQLLPARRMMRDLVDHVTRKSVVDAELARFLGPWDVKV
jgi:lipopolysaccharide biosynthesis glycosyltransferase